MNSNQVDLHAHSDHHCKLVSAVPLADDRETCYWTDFPASAAVDAAAVF